MARPISSVHVDIARLVLEVSELSMESAENPDKAIADWTRSLVRCLALRDPSLHPYGAHLLAETEEYRRADSERKKANKSGGKHDGRQLSADSTESPPRALQSITDQINKKDITSEPSAPPGGEGVKPKGKGKKTPFPSDSPPYVFAEFFAKFHRDWAKGAKAPDAARLQKWATVFDAMNRIDGRTWDAIEGMLNAIDQEKPSSGSTFLWRNAILSPDSLRLRWNEGKLHRFIPERDHER